MCEVGEIILDKGGIKMLCSLGVRFRHERRAKLESVFSFQQRAKIFFRSITVNFRRREKRFAR